MTVAKVAKSAEDQAVGAWIWHLVDARLAELQQSLDAQDLNLEQSLELIRECRQHIYEDVIENGKGRGGEDGMHGFIAEWLEVYVGNAKRVVTGELGDMVLNNDNGVADYHIAEVAYQSKFSLKYLSLDALLDHARKNPEFVREGGQYTIPADFYDRLREINSMSEEDLGAIVSTERTLWRKIQELKVEGVEIDENLHPSAFRFLDARREHVDETLLREERGLRETDEELRRAVEEKGSPSLDEALHVAAVSAALEAAMALALGTYRKMKAGKRLRDFDADDWKDLGVETAIGAAKGGVRGGAVYGLVNFAKLPGAIATAAVTATFAMVGQADQLRLGNISPEEFLMGSEAVCMDCAVSAISSMVGQVALPVPVLGALVGNVTGTLMYEIAKANLSNDEMRLIAEHTREAEEYAASLDEESAKLLADIETQDMLLDDILERAFSSDANIAFPASIENARNAGVPESKIIKTDEEGFAFFMS